MTSDEHVTYMPAEQFDELLRTIDEPDDAPGLMAAMKRRQAATVCEHCGRKGQVYGRVGDHGVCHPNVGMDCYRLVTVYQEPIGARLPGGPLDGKPSPIPNTHIPF